ncbi:hypothetical protein [Sulfitobacter sp. Ks41]|uniref:hypothetical protein n=1 Tax=Sulfitobacter sp. Ks41 TaxID=2731139 RepID=UPI0023E195E4|nr:hypothetical protein [Sulfitobacter sp. Ks41]
MPDDPAGDGNGEILAVVENGCTANAVGHDLEVASCQKRKSDFLAGGANVQKNGRTIGDDTGNPFGDALFLSCLAALTLPPCPLVQGTGESDAAMCPLDPPELFQLVHIASYGLGRHTESLGSLSQRDITALFGNTHQRGAAFVFLVRFQ